MLTSLICFLSLLATGFCLLCERCSSTNSTCSGPPYSCPKKQKHCLIVTTEYLLGNERWMSTYKGCTRKSYCFPPSTTFTFPSQRKRRAAMCCTKPLCNRGTVKLPPMNTKPNGLLCSGCFSKQSMCKPTETLKCHGKESKCIYYDMSVQQGDQVYTFAKRGCGTKFACLNKPYIGGIPGLFVEMMKTAQCTLPARGFT
ncbi:phospholipase A2 inhibitor and Ly6/PLAUR domain-containing protein-like [Anolis sagrei]|uniref:phospholipase A2 inhibitor and Ly6/PLAUR domain-containing protein-like n=1 Tax=Anolis sagrei TaxID=38937 RepID=UPI00295B3748|nr:phospholipase A2 inhibitor and Ly6/PLAUR domain-containing protein-like [Anolis sagrei ordinatus]